MINKISENYGHKINAEITDDSNDDDPGTSGKELLEENADNTTGTNILSLGRGHQRVIPLCVVWAVRSCYPAMDGHYVGFKEY